MGLCLRSVLKRRSFLSCSVPKLRMRPMRAAVLLCVAFASCNDSSTVRLVDAGTVADVDAGVGPAPLRRWTNEQLSNVLHDLFPAVVLPLPKLPRESSQSGFENDVTSQAPSDVRVSRYESIASLYAEALSSNSSSLEALAGCTWSTEAESTPCARQFIARFGRRAFRRPLSADEIDRYAVRFANWKNEVNFEGAAQLMIATLLQSPQFLYLPEQVIAGVGLGAAALDPFSLATRLSVLLWQSAPDEQLLQAAESGQLSDPEKLRIQTERMLSDEKAKRVMWSFHRQWLGIERIHEDEHLVRTAEIDPHWSAATPASAEMEVRLFIEDILFHGGTVKDLLTSPLAWVDSEMERLYGIATSVPHTEWQKVVLPQGQRAGLLTRAAFLAGNSHRGATSPPIRGNSIQLHLLCMLPRPPPPNIDVTPPRFDPTNAPKTNRDLFDERTSPPKCRGCHMSLNGIGFGLENYSASGAFQTTDHGLPVNAAGELFDTDVDQTFQGGVELSRALADSNDVLRCAVLRWLSYALGREPTEAEQITLQRLQNRFVQSGGNVRQLLMDIVFEPTFLLRESNQ
jgi:hypothetical protein